MNSPAITDPTELRRTVRALWRAAAAFGALAFSLRLLVIFWLQPIAWRMPSWLGLATTLAVTFLAAAVPLAAYAACVKSHRRLPRTFLIDRRYAVPFSPWFGCYLVMSMAIAPGAIAVDRTADGGADLANLGWLPASFVVEAIVMAVVWPVLRGPSLELTPAGVVLRRWFSGLAGRTVPWDEIVADRIPAPAPARRVRLPLRPVHHGHRTVPIGAGWLWVDPVFLLSAIQHYAEDPDHRAAIGTPEELERLHEALEEDGMTEVPAAEQVTES